MSGERPEVLVGATYKIDVGDSPDISKPLYMTVNDVDGRPLEVFIRVDEPELFEWVTVVTVFISRALQLGVNAEQIAADMVEVCSPATRHFHQGREFSSLAARIGSILVEHEKRVRDEREQARICACG